MNALNRFFLLSSILWAGLSTSSAYCDYTPGAMKRDLDRGHYENVMKEYEANLAILKQDVYSKKLSEFYDKLMADENEAGLKEWTRAQSNNPVPWTANGLKLLYEGEKVRGGDLASKLTKDQTDLFTGKINQAVSYFRKAISLNPEDPYAYDGMIQAGRNVALAETEMKADFDKAMEIVPGFDPAFWNMSLYYSPLWGGKAEQMLQFVKQYGNRAPKGSKARLLIIQYYEDLGFARFDNGAHFCAGPEWKVIKKEFEDYLAVHPENRQVHSWYSYCAFYGKHYAEAVQEFDILKEQQEGDGYWTDVNFARAKVAAKFRNDNY